MSIFTNRLLRAVVVVVAGALLATPSFAAAVIGKSLQAKLAGLADTQALEIIVTFEGDGPLTEGELSALDTLGVNGLYFQALPIAGVVATADQIDAIVNLAGVRSVWLNEPVELFNNEARALTGVDRLQADANMRTALGLPYSGKGVGVLINDSGIDGTHPDLTYGGKTVQNVMGATNLNAYDDLLPVTYVEGVADTDIGSGHGTHVSGTAAGTGAASGGQYAGVAQGADLIGYGSGAVIFVLDTLGGFDYALVNQFRYNIRVVNNSWGQSGTEDPFDPNDPTSVATKLLSDRGMIIVFAAGNDGSGEGTIGGGFIKAPWVVTVGAGNKDGTLADFSSRGLKNVGGAVVVDGEEFEWKDRPNIVAPGVGIVSAFSKTGALGYLDPVNADYAIMQGTSMAAPHTAGVIALMLEANPRLTWREVIDILESTATNMPGREDWEVGAGYINTYAAVMTAAGMRDDFGSTPNVKRDFNAEAHETRIQGPDFDLFFDPLLDNDAPALGSGKESFTVAAGLSTVIAKATVPDNTIAIVLTDPDGKRYGSAISLPQLGERIAVTAPAVPGVWTVEIRGIGSVSGVVLDPLGLTNGTGAPGTISVDVDFNRVDSFTGLNDIAGHPAEALIKHGVAERLLDSHAGGYFDPDGALTRSDLADYLTQGGAIRQFRLSNGGAVFNDTMAGLSEATAEAVTARGAALRDLKQVQKGVVKPAAAGAFDGDGTVSRAELAYSLVQALGFEAEAEAARVALESEAITVVYKQDRIALEDDADIPAELRGYVQLALDLQLMRASFWSTQGPFDFEPTIHAKFEPNLTVTRGAYAFNAVNFLDRYSQQP